MKKPLLICLGILLILSATGLASPEKRDHSQRIVFEKYLWADGVNPKARYLDQLMVKFFDEDSVRLRDGQLTSLNGRSSLGYARDFLARHHEIEARVIISNKSEGQYEENLQKLEQQSGWDLVDLFSFCRFQLPEPAANPKALLADILNAPEVETAYYEPIPLDATCTDLGAVTPNFIPNQTYHDPAPLGTDLDYAQSAFGADLVDGMSGTWVGIFETGMQTTHEDFTQAVVRTSGTPGYSDHGTAVTGIVGGCDDNGVGVLGYLADETMNLYQRNSGSYPSVEDIYNFANGQLLPGEVTTNSWQYFSDPMPPGQTCPCNSGQNGCVTIEYNAALKAEIEAGVAAGINYFISAGNGCVNLDDATFGSTFRYSTDTGSNYVGAVKSTLPHDSSCYTNWGERVDLCAWGNGIYSTGYGYAFSGTGPDEYYDNDFGGTSGAGPIVAGCAGVLNNIYRNVNGGDNIWTSDMRSWLQIGGTEAGTFPGVDDPEMPNLFGITAPDLQPFQPGGWTDRVVPRNSDNASWSSAELPTNLLSDPDTSYLNSAIVNLSHFGAAVPARWYLYRDDVLSSGYIYSDGLGPWTGGYYCNHAWFVRGGRHTIRHECDPNNEVTEYFENNNRYVTQFVWDPRQLTAATPLTFGAPPDMYVTGQPGGYSNCDGYVLVAGFDGWWDLFAVVASSSADYDTRVYSETITSTNGFDDYETWSGYGGSTIDIVGKNKNWLGFSSTLASVINWSGSDDYKVEGVTASFAGIPGTGRINVGTFTISADQIMKAVEFYVDTLLPYNIEADVTSGNANLVISVFGPDDQYFALGDRNVTANAHGAGQDELISCWTPAQTGYHVAVFHKYDSNDYGQTATFTAYIGKSGFDLTHKLLPGWSHQLVVTQSLGAQPFVLPASLAGNVGTNYLHQGMVNQGCSASPFGLNTRFYLDGPSVFTTGSMTSWPAGADAWVYNQGPIAVFGGRHNIGDSIDVFQEGTEWREDNNRWDEQFVWTPFPLTNQTPTFTTTPAPCWANSESSVYFPAWNQDGWRFTGTYWSGVAVMPMCDFDQYLCAMYNPSIGSQNGFDTDLVHSFAGTLGSVNFVVENGNINGWGASFDVGVLGAWAWPSDSFSCNYRMYQCNRIQDLQVDALNGPFNLGVGRLINVFDVYLNEGVSKRFILDNLGAVDLGLAIFDADDAFGSRTDNGHYTNAGGVGADESVVFTPTTTGWHGVVVFKNDLTDLPSVDYRLIIGDRVPAAPQHLVLQVMNSQVSPILMRAHWDSVTTDMNGAPLNVDYYQLYYTLSTNPAAFPTGWVAFATTTQATVNFGVGIGVVNLRMVVVALDSDGMILAHSPLPDGNDITGTRLDENPVLFLPEDGPLPVIHVNERGFPSSQ